MTDQLTKIPPEYLIAALAACFFLGLLAFIIFAGTIAAALKNIRGLFEQQQAAQQIGPQPFEVKAAAQFTHHADFQRLESDFKALRDERKRDVGELHNRIDKLDREMGGVQATLNLNTDHLVRIEEKLDRPK